MKTANEGTKQLRYLAMSTLFGAVVGTAGLFFLLRGKVEEGKLLSYIVGGGLFVGSAAGFVGGVVSEVLFQTMKD